MTGDTKDFLLTIDVLDKGDGCYSIPESMVSYGEESCRQMVNTRLASMGVSRKVGYKTLWRWRIAMDWKDPPYSRSQIESLALLGRYVTRERDGGLGLSLERASTLTLEKIINGD